MLIADGKYILEKEELEKPSIIEIDPHGKYMLETPFPLEPEVAETIKKAWEEFITDRKQHLFILHEGLILKKIDKK